jgi:hypothetical protein
LRYQVLGRTAWGRRRLLTWGNRVRRDVLASHFVGGAEDVGELRA